MWDNDSRLTVRSRGHASATGTTRRPRVRAYADPVTNLILAAIDDAIYSAGGVDQLGDPTDIGVISISATGPASTLGELAATVSTGRMSPTRFGGAGPGFLAGMACIDYKFRGPSLVLTCPADVGAPAAADVASAWLANGSCRYVFVCEHRTSSDQVHTISSILLQRRISPDLAK